MLFCEKASDVWKELVETYGQSNKARLFQAQKEISCISQAGLDIVAYFNKAKKAWDEFTAVGATPKCTCGKCECDVNSRLQGYEQEQRVIQFIMGLNESYTPVRGNILMMKPFPTLGQVYSLLVQEEKQRQVKSGGIFQTESASFSAETGQIGGQSSGRLLQARKQERGKTRPYCSHCKRQGHIMETCYKIHGYPNRQGGKNKNYRGANGAWGEQESQTDQLSSTPILPGLNQEQSKQLFQFLTN